MRRFLLLTALVLPTTLLQPTVRTQEPTLPNAADYPPAGENCKRKIIVTPWVGTPGVDWPNTFRCVLKIHTCGGVREYRSGVRPSGASMCADYWRAHNELVDREICCDTKPTCEKPVPWIGPPPAGCKEVETPNVRAWRQTGEDVRVSLSFCGQYFNWVGKLFVKGEMSEAQAYETKLKEWVRMRMGTKVCCDSLRDLPLGPNGDKLYGTCYPVMDIDCDGRLDLNDVTATGMPDINFFSTAQGAGIDPFPPGLNPDDTEFFPPQDKCDCKWELVKGTLTCSSGGNQPHLYQARWKCPSSGNERFTRKEAPAGAPCAPPGRAAQ